MKYPNDIRSLVFAVFLFALILAGVIAYNTNYGARDNIRVTGRAEGYLDSKSSRIDIVYGKKTLAAHSGQEATLACYESTGRVKLVSKPITVTSDKATLSITEATGRHLASGGDCFTTFLDGQRTKAHVGSGSYQWPNRRTCSNQDLPCEAEFVKGREGDEFPPGYDARQTARMEASQ